MKLKQIALIAAIAIGASNLTLVIIRVLDQIRHAEEHQSIETRGGSPTEDNDD